MRRKLAFTMSSVIFVLIISLAITSVANIANSSPAVLAVAGFVIFTTIVLMVALSGMLMLAHQSDHSLPVALSAQLATLVPAQKDLVKMALLVFFIGTFYWVVYLAISVKGDLLQYCQALLDSFAANASSPFGIAGRVICGVLYFTLLVLISMRLFFSLPLMFFHDLDYTQAQRLGQRGLFINLQPVTSLLIVWIVVLSLSIKIAPWLAVVLVPLMASYSYVAYRHVFLGEKQNSVEQAIVSTEAARVSVI